MFTFQDFQEVPQRDDALMEFARMAIYQHKTTGGYQEAVTAQDYDRKCNTSIMRYQKTLRTLTGREVPDRWSPNHKTRRNLFNYFITQQNQYLLGNGVTWDDPAVGDKLGDDFDTDLQELCRDALVDGVAFGFWNLDHLDVFRLTEFVPLWDEENGSLRAGIRWWQVDDQKPLRATLYEEDGYTDYLWDLRKNEGGGEVLHAKRAYKQIVRSSPVDGTVIMDGENYPSFPIIPMWANPQHQSELVGIREQIDAYDLIKNGFLNDLDTAQIYWIIRNAGGMDDVDMAKFLDRLRMLHATDVDGDTDVQAQTVEIPYSARETLLNRLERDLYRDYMALNVDDIRSGAVTATQIKAAYEPMNIKADQYEYCVRKFLKALLSVAGMASKPSFTRSMLINTGEDVQTVLAASTALTSEYVTRKVLTLLGDGDQADEILEQMEEEEMARAGVGGEEADELEDDTDTEVDDELNELDSLIDGLEDEY